MNRPLAFCVTAFIVAYSPSAYIDPDEPFRIELGRGSGMYGLHTVRVEHDGSVVLHRQKDRTRGWWVTATLKLRPDQLKAVIAAVESSGVLELDRAYQNPNIRDGHQAAFRVRQGKWEKRVSFSNNFPRQFLRFAQQLDRILNEAGVENAVWQPVPEAELRHHERELWGSIRR